MKRESHHVAGRVHCDDTISLCVDCHRTITRWQHAAGIDLRHQVDHSELTQLRARLVGYALMCELASRIYGRIIGRMLDDGSSPKPLVSREGSN